MEYNQFTFDSVPTTENMIVNSTMAVLTGLQEYVDYSIRVRAYTGVGPGPYSDVMNVTTNEDGKNINITVSTLFNWWYVLQNPMQLQSIS